MINSFDLSVGMPRAKLLADTAQRDGSPTRRSWQDSLKKSPEPAGFHFEDKSKFFSEPWQNSSCMKSGGGMPMKTHLAQEMSKEAEFLQRPPGIIAKLMGLDAMPAQQPVLAANKSWHESYPHNASTRASLGSQDFEDCYFSSPLPLGIPSYVQEQKCKDVYEVRKQHPSVKHWINEVSPTRKCRPIDCSDDRRMAMVRQKFIEAKRLALDEKLMQSKEFQDALEVLSSNKDLLLKFLEEPNSLFSKHLNEFHSTIPPQSQTRRITVLQPPKSWNLKGEKRTKQQLHSAAEELGQNALNAGRLPSSFNFSKDENPTQPTRIVVLKPGLVKPHSSDNSYGLNLPSSTKSLDERDFSKVYEADEAIGSRQMAKETTRNMRENFSHIGYDSISSSGLSNGYVGDESSFNRSECEYMAAEDGNSSGSDIASPSSRHSWSHASRYAASPFSVSSFNWASHSPESSVTKEAKKRLSERLAVVTFRGVNQEIENVQSSSTLGEMLAMSEIKNCEGKAVSSSMKAGGSDENYWSYLSRSKSSPLPSSNDDTISSMAEVPGSSTCKPIPLKETPIAAPKSSKTSWKLSRLFFPKSKKSKKPIPPDGGLCAVAESSGEDHEGSSHDDISSVYSGRSAARPTTQGATTSSKILQAALALDRACSSESLSDSQEQPSPVSVLEARFQDDTNRCGHEASHILNLGHLQAVSRSPPIGSLARSLSWDSSHETNPKAQTSNSWKHSVSSTKAAATAAEEEQERFLFVHKLLSSAGMDEETCGSAAFSRWHSPDTPLDPALLHEESFGGKEEGAKFSEWRCHQRLLFDSINEALLEMGQAAISGGNDVSGTFRCSRTCRTALVRGDESERPSVPEEVCRLLNGWFSAGGRRLPDRESDGAAGGSVGWVVREVVGREWKESIWRDVDEISKEIGTRVFEEVMGEALEDLTALCI